MMTREKHKHTFSQARNHKRYTLSFDNIRCSMRTYKSLATILLTVGSLPASFGFSVSNRIQSQSLKLPTHSFSPNLKTLNARTFSSTRIHQAPLDEDSPLDQDSPLYINTDPVFDGTNTVVLVAGQSLLIGFAVIASKILVSISPASYSRDNTMSSERLPFCHGDLIVSQT